MFLHFAQISLSITVQQIEGFSFQGIGFCMDSKGYRYDSYYKTDVGTEQDCAAYCIHNEQFRGVVIEDGNRCRCLYEDGLLMLVSGMYDGYGLTVGGVGKVTSADGGANAKCFKVNDE